jgi:membrane-associated phospholipid phosphatase
MPPRGNLPLPVRLLAGYALLCGVAALAILALGDNAMLFEWINAGADRALPDSLLTSATILGNALCALMLLAPAVVRAPQVIAAGLLATVPASLLSYVPKHLIAEARPAAVLDASLVHVHGIRLAGTTSFPSGHALTVFAVVAVLVCTSRSLRARPAAAIAVVLAGTLVAASRIAVGAHWPVDVLAGIVLGCIAGAAGAAWSERWTFWRRRSGALAIATIIAGCALALVLSDTGYPTARPLKYALATIGLVSAWFGFAFHLRPPAAGTA